MVVVYIITQPRTHETVKNIKKKKMFLKHDETVKNTKKLKMFLEPLSHFVSWYYLINALTLCVYLPLRERHHGNTEEQGGSNI